MPCARLEKRNELVMLNTNSRLIFESRIYGKYIEVFGKYVRHTLYTFVPAGVQKVPPAFFTVHFAEENDIIVGIHH